MTEDSALPRASFAARVPSSAGTHYASSSNASTSGASNRIVVRPGYSQMDWLRRCKRERVDGSSENAPKSDAKRVISREELAKHNTREDCWIGLRGRVYNLTHYVEYHPGGEEILAPSYGTDATALFDKYHKYVNGEYIMRATQVGVMPGFVDDEDSE